MPRRVSLALVALLIAVNLYWAVSAAEATAAPIRKGDLVVTVSDGTQVKSEDNVLMTLPAKTWLVAADVQDDSVLVRVRKDGREVAGFVQAGSLRREALKKYIDAHGFTLQYPESWKVPSAEFKADTARRAKEYEEKLSSSPPPSEMSVISGDSTSGANVDCFTSPVFLPEPDDRTAKDYAAGVRGELEKAGLKPAKIRAEVGKVSNTKAIYLWGEITTKGMSVPLRVWQARARGKGRSCTITCTALASEFWRYEPLFAAMIQSFEVDVDGPTPPPTPPTPSAPRAPKAFQ